MRVEYLSRKHSTTFAAINPRGCFIHEGEVFIKFFLSTPDGNCVCLEDGVVETLVEHAECYSINLKVVEIVG